MGLLDLTADLTYNTNFETEPVQNQTGPEVNNNFQTSNLESSPTEEIGSVNFFSDDLVSGFTQFMTYPDTLYPGEGLTNSGIVDHFPNPHNYTGDTPFQIEGFTADMQKYETLYPSKDALDLSGINSGIVDSFPNPHNYDGDTGFSINGFTANMQKYETLYPSKDTLEISGINNGIVDSFPSPHGIGHFGAETQSPHNIEGFVANVEPLSDGFYPNTIELGSVDFFPGGNFSNNFVTSTGFTQDAEPFGGSKIETEFKMIGEGNVLNQDFMNNELFQSVNTLGTYKGAVNFFSDTDSYASGFTKDFSVVHNNIIPTDLSLITKYDVSKFYLDKEMSFSVTSGTPSPSVTTYPIQGSIFTSIVDVFDDEGDPIGTDEVFSVYSLGKFQLGKVAGMGERGQDPFTYDELKLNMSSWNVDGFNYGTTTNGVGDNVTGYTKGIYSIVDGNASQFTNLVNEGKDLKLSGINYDGQFSDLSIGYSAIPSLSIPKPKESISSGPFETNSGFEGGGDFKLLASDQGSILKYLSDGSDDLAVEGKIVRDANDSSIRSGATTLKSIFDDGNGTDFRDLSNMDASSLDYPNAPFGYSDGVSDSSGFGSMFGSYGLIDKKVDEGIGTGLTPDIFVRESGGFRFVGRIVKDLERTLKRTLSPAGVIGVAKDAVMAIFNPSDNSIYSNLLTRFTAGTLGQFGIRGSSVSSNIASLVVDSVFGNSKGSFAKYENRVDKMHPDSNPSILEGGNPLRASVITSTPAIKRTLTTRYGQPKYPVHRALSKAAKAQGLYGGGMLKTDSTRARQGRDRISIKSYGEDYGNDKDLIKFYFRDIRNRKTLIFRAFLTNIQDSVSPEWNNYRYIGRPDDVYVYKGTSRSVSFSMKVAAFSRREMIPMWEKINYLVGLNYGSYVDTSVFDEGTYYQNNPGMSSPICKMTIGDYLTEQTGYIKDFNISIPPDYPWDTIVDDGGKNVIGELPQMVDINMGFQIIPQQIPDSYGKHFGKVGASASTEGGSTHELVGTPGLSWLKDIYQNVPALKGFDESHKKYLKQNKIALPEGEPTTLQDIMTSEDQVDEVTDVSNQV